MNFTENEIIDSAAEGGLWPAKLFMLFLPSFLDSLKKDAMYRLESRTTMNIGTQPLVLQFG